MQALFETGRFSSNNSQPLDTPANGFFSVAPWLPVVIGEQRNEKFTDALMSLRKGYVISKDFKLRHLIALGGKTMYRFLVRDAGGEAERSCLAEAIPQWVAEQIMEDGQPPKFTKILFFLTPHSMNGKSLKRYCLNMH